MAVFFTNAYNISIPAEALWVDIDVSSYCPVGTTGVIIQLTAGGGAFGLRKKGSTDERIGAYSSGTQRHMFIGVDGDRKLQGYGGGETLRLIGYFTLFDAVFFDNGYDKSITATGWKDIDCSAQIPAGAKAAIFEVCCVSGGDLGLRKNGSTDDRTFFHEYHCGAIVALDANRICEGYITNNDNDFFLVGYLIEGDFKTNGLDKSFASPIGAYVNLDLTLDSPPANCTGVLIEVKSQWDAGMAFRKDGSSDDFYDFIAGKWYAVGMDIYDIFEAKEEYGDENIYIMGYFVTEAIPPTPFSQVNFRFFNDDGDEDESTPKGAENANVSAPAGTALRLRFLIDVSGNPDAKNFQLEYRKPGDTWKIMEVEK